MEDNEEKEKQNKDDIPEEQHDMAEGPFEEPHPTSAQMTTPPVPSSSDNSTSKYSSARLLRLHGNYPAAANAEEQERKERKAALAPKEVWETLGTGLTRTITEVGVEAYDGEFFHAVQTISDHGRPVPRMGKIEPISEVSAIASLLPIFPIKF